jgi:hypothetical protein
VALRVLASGVDTLHLSARGAVRAEVWEALEAAKREAQAEEAAVPFDFPATGRAFLVKPYGLRGYTYWLASPDFELMLGRSERFPAAIVQLHSAGLHSMGAERAVDAAEALLRAEVFASPAELVVSRVDVYADSTGWELELADLDRFVCRGRSRRGFVERELTFASGRRLTGFMFGRDALVARLYDKTAEIALRGVTWLHDLWGERDGEAPVWRLELQYRRKVLVEFGLRTVDEVLAGVQDLWRYGTHEWLTLRTPTYDRRPHRWPVDPTWAEVAAVEVAPESCGVVRQRIAEAAEGRIVSGLQGYVTSWAALRESYGLHSTMEAVRPILDRYLAERGRTFEAEMRRKRARLLSVTAFDGEEAA